MMQAFNIPDLFQLAAEISFWKQQLNIAKEFHAGLLRQQNVCLLPDDILRERVTSTFMVAVGQLAYLVDVLCVQLGDVLQRYREQTVDVTPLYPFVFSGVGELTAFEQEYQAARARVTQVVQKQLEIFMRLSNTPYLFYTQN